MLTKKEDTLKEEKKIPPYGKVRVGKTKQSLVLLEKSKNKAPVLVPLCTE